MALMTGSGEPKSLETSHAGIARIGFEGLSQHCDHGRHPCFNESRLKHNPQRSRSLRGLIGQPFFRNSTQPLNPAMHSAPNTMAETSMPMPIQKLWVWK